MSWYQFGIFVIMLLIIGSALERLATIQRETRDHLRRIAALLEGAAEETAVLRSDVERIAHYAQTGPQPDYE